jgi:hypothetical protein
MAWGSSRLVILSGRQIFLGSMTNLRLLIGINANATLIHMILPSSCGEILFFINLSLVN